jgi:ABC-type polysaccharide/polyol phosphate export permease
MTSRLIFDICMHRRHPRIAALGRNAAAGIRDLAVGARRWRLWYLIGSADMRKRFARARLGQLWIVLANALSVSIIGLSWAVLWHQPVDDMLPFVAASMTIWQFLAAVLNDMTTAFPSYSHYFLNQYMPASTIIYAVLYKNIATFLLNMVFPIFIIVGLGKSLTPCLLFSVIGLFLLILWCISLGYAVAILCARFRDIVQVVSSLLQVAFFVTPVMWKPEFLPREADYLLTFNPLAPLLAVVRDPLLGRPVPLTVWLTVSAIVLATLVCSLPFIGRFCRRLVYWL